MPPCLDFSRTVWFESPSIGGPKVNPSRPLDALWIAVFAAFGLILSSAEDLGVLQYVLTALGVRYDVVYLWAIGPTAMCPVQPDPA